MARYLTPGAKLVYELLSFHAADKGWCYPSIATLAVETGLVTSVVEDAIYSLECHGHVTRVRTERQEEELKRLVHAYYDQKNDREGSRAEMARLFPKTPQEGPRQRVNIYILRWSEYADRAWEWQELTPQDRRTRHAIGLIAALVQGLPKLNSKAGGERVKRQYRKKDTPVQAAPAAHPAGAARPPAEAEKTPHTGPHPDLEGVLAFWSNRYFTLFHRHSSITDAERQAVNDWLNRKNKQNEQWISREQTEALIGWYLQWCRKGEPKLGLPTPVKGALGRPNLKEACSQWAITECRVALDMLRWSTIPLDAIGNLPRNRQELAEAERRVAKALKKSGMDSLQPSFVLMDYLARQDKKNRGTG